VRRPLLLTTPTSANLPVRRPERRSTASSAGWRWCAAGERDRPRCRRRAVTPPRSVQRRCNVTTATMWTR